MGNKDLKSSISQVSEENTQNKGETMKLGNSDSVLILPKISNKESNDYNTNNANLSKELETKINQLSKLYEVENYKNKYSNKETLKILNLLKSSEKFKKENYQANTNKINNMLNPYNHNEYSPGDKNHNMIRDNLKIHAEQILRFKHLERNENKKNK